MAECGYHPGRDAVGACVACGKMVCAECRTTLGGKIYCQPCAEEIFVKKKAGGSSSSGVTKAAPVAEEKIEGYWWLLVIFLVWEGLLPGHLIGIKPRMLPKRCCGGGLHSPLSGRSFSGL